VLDSIRQHPSHRNCSNIKREWKQKQRNGTKILTCNLAASNQTSPLFRHCSQPCFIIFQAATILPACSSKQAAAIRGMLWFRPVQGIEQQSCSFDITDFGIGFYEDVSSEVRYPLGSTDVEVPVEVEVPEI
jgi:hypothetical protein